MRLGTRFSARFWYCRSGMPTASAPIRTHGRRSAARRAAPPLPVLRLPVHHRLAVALSVIALVTGFSIVPTDAALAASLVVAPAATLTGDGRASASAVVAAEPDQHIAVDATIAAPPVSRDSIAATDSIKTLSNNGTNADWAKLVLIFGGWPQTDANVTLMLRWMRQENGPPDWWLRNNPLNNGYGSGGGSGLGSYPDLVTAAKYCAENLQRGYPDIVAGLASSASPDVTAPAIWASPWASSHYGYGTRWSTSPVQIVKAPASAWGG